MLDNRNSNLSGLVLRFLHIAQHHLNTKAKNYGTAGFTIPELTASMVIIGIIVTGIFASTAMYFNLITKNNARIDMTNDSQNLLRATVEALRYGDGIRQSNTITDANSPPGGWNTSNSSFVIVLAVPAIDSSRNFIIDSSTGSPYMNELVYYKSGNSLMRRTLANPSASGNNLKTSCPPASANAACPADRDLADYFSSMVFTLYDQNGVVVTDPGWARSIKIDLTMSRTILGTNIAITNSIRSTLRNTF